jgi:hypothetical protein
MNVQALGLGGCLFAQHQLLNSRSHEQPIETSQLGTDSHYARQLDFIELGLAAAPKARIPAERIVNFMDVASLRARVKKLRDR